MSSLQKSIWSFDTPSDSDHHVSLPNNSNEKISNKQSILNAWSNETSKDGKNDSEKLGSLTWICIQCCIVGFLLAGIGLTVILTLWLVPSSNTKTTSQAPSIITSSTSTISTTTETTTTTPVTIPTPTPPCGVTPYYSANTLLYLTQTIGTISTVYKCYTFEWTSSVTRTVNLNFQFRNDFHNWNLDDVSVYGGATQMLVNGYFDTGSLSPWIITQPSGNCIGSTGGRLGTSPHYGGYNLQDNCKSKIDTISQSFTATAGQMYVVSFWLQADMVAPTMIANVSLS